MKRQKENVLKGCNYASAVATPDFKSILAIGSDLRLKELEDIPGGGMQITKDVDSDIQLTQLAIPSSRFHLGFDFLPRSVQVADCYSPRRRKAAFERIPTRSMENSQRFVVRVNP